MTKQICFLVIVTILFSHSLSEAAKPLSRGDRILSISVNETRSVDYNTALHEASKAGIMAVSIPQNWDDLETKPEVFNPQINYLAIANQYYIGTGLYLSLGINPIDINNIRTPSDLRGKAWDDPQVIERYKRLLDYALIQVNALELNSLNIGNEIDGALATPEDWQAYERFFKEVADYARGFWPGLAVGTKGMMHGLTGRHKKQFQRINQHADVVMVTYYPLNEDFSVKTPKSIHADFKELMALYPDKPIYIMEIGYPSGKKLGSSQVAQANFVTEVFRLWDENYDHIKYIEFTWMHEQPSQALDMYEQYYGIKNTKFREFLGTLGLRSEEGRNKAAFERLLKEANRRGWRKY